jgi:dihydrofolate reductase
VDEALALAGADPVSVIGGAEIFEVFLPHAHRFELTEVLGDVVGDTAMPDPRSAGDWREVAREEHQAEGEVPAFRFITLERA